MSSVCQEKFPEIKILATKLHSRTDLYSLLEFSPRKDQNIEKGYLAGRYGAVPSQGR
jgi:AAA15 family ATPase/GTPase